MGPVEQFRQQALQEGHSEEEIDQFLRSQGYQSNAADLKQAAVGVMQGMNPVEPLWDMAKAGPVAMVGQALDRGAALRKQAGEEFQQGRYMDAIQHGLGGAVPFLGPMLSDALDTVASPESTPKASGKALGGLLAMKTTPKAMSLAGRAVKAPAPSLFEAGMGIGSADRLNAKTPGTAGLEFTRGFHPMSVAQSADAAMTQKYGLLSNLAARASSRGVKGSLRPARQPVEDRIAEAGGVNNTSAVRELRPMLRQLTTPSDLNTLPTEYPAGSTTPVRYSTNPFSGRKTVVPTGSPPDPVVAENQSPTNLLKMKQEFGKAHTTWNAIRPKNEVGTAREVYRGLDSEIDRIIPEGAQLNQEVSSLIPIKDRAIKVNSNASMPQRIMGRWKAHSGALLGTVAGGAAYGPAGAIAGAIVPELMATPAVQIGAARGLWGAGKALQGTAAQRAAQAGLIMDSARGTEVKPWEKDWR